MKLTIHHSSTEIGGNCIEVEASGKRLVLDIGQPLLEDGEAQRELKLPSSLDTSKPVEGLLISHSHMDHFGLLRLLPQNWQAWSGKATEEIIKFNYTSKGQTLNCDFRNFEHRRPFDVGPFRITPYLIDHSAFDAYMFLVEADGKRILYSGDFRLTGRKRRLSENIVRRPPKDIDALIIEGTNLGRDEDREYWTEYRIEKEFVRRIRGCRGRIFVTCSSQNIDRLVSIFKAAKRCNVPFIIDIHTARVLSVVNRLRPTIPSPYWKEIKMLTTRMLIRKLQTTNAMSFFDAIYKARQTFGIDSLAKLGSKAVILIRDSMVPDFEVKGFRLTPEDIWCWSIWSHYLEKESNRQIRGWFDSAGIKPITIHTSGHASKNEIGRLIETVNAGKNIIIHSWADENIKREFRNSYIPKNGEAIAI